MDVRHKTGIQAEQRAREFLDKQGMAFITKNFYCKLGEIDLIMQDKAELVFVEVRFRANTYYGDALESISTAKQKKIIKTALYFLKQKNLLDKVDYRFDVIGITKDNLEWIKNAFNAEILL